MYRKLCISSCSSSEVLKKLDADSILSSSRHVRSGDAVGDSILFGVGDGHVRCAVTKQVS